MWYECCVMCPSCRAETQILKVLISEQHELQMQTECIACRIKLRTVEMVPELVRRAFQSTATVQ
jgi:hypothetical protein